MKIYMRVTEDEYELPIAVADSQAELAQMVGASRNSIASALCHQRTGSTKHSVYKEVEVEDD